MTQTLKTRILNIPDISIEDVEKIALKAGEVLKRNYEDKIINSYGNRTTIVKETNKLIRNMLKYSLADIVHCRFYSEDEDYKPENKGLQWIVDPLDGKENVLGYPPLMAISIGLVNNKEPVLGVIYDPIHDQLFSAKHRSGAWLNGKSIKVSEKTSIKNARIGFDFKKGEKSIFIKQLNQVLDYVMSVKVFGSPVLNMAAVSAGKLDLYFKSPASIVDFTAGVCIVREAGGKAVDFNGKDWKTNSKGVVAGPKGVVEEFVKHIKES